MTSEMDEVSSTLLSSIGVTPQRLQDLAETKIPADLQGTIPTSNEQYFKCCIWKRIKKAAMVANPGEADPVSLVADCQEPLHFRTQLSALFFRLARQS
jgi:hypothetical protein